MNNVKGKLRLSKIVLQKKPKKQKPQNKNKMDVSLGHWTNKKNIILELWTEQ